MEEKIKIINRIKKGVFIYLLISLFGSIIISLIRDAIGRFNFLYVVFSLFIPITGIKRVLICLTILLPLILLFLMDIIKYKKQKITSIISIALLLLKIRLIIFAMNLSVDYADLFTLLTQWLK